MRSPYRSDQAFWDLLRQRLVGIRVKKTKARDS